MLTIFAAFLNMRDHWHNDHTINRMFVSSASRPRKVISDVHGLVRVQGQGWDLRLLTGLKCSDGPHLHVSVRRQEQLQYQK